MTTLSENLAALGASSVRIDVDLFHDRDPRDDYDTPEPWDDRPFEEHAMKDQLMDEADRGAFDG